MAKDEIKKLLENSKRVLETEHEDFTKIIKNDLQNFKKKTFDEI